MDRRVRSGSGAWPVAARSANGLRSRGGPVVAAHRRRGNRACAARLLAHGSHGPSERAASSVSWISFYSGLSWSCPHQCSRCHLVQHEIGGLVFPAIPPLGEIYSGRLCLGRSVPAARRLGQSSRRGSNRALKRQGFLPLPANFKTTVAASVVRIPRLLQAALG